MAGNDAQWGILVIIAAAFFLFTGLDIMKSDVISFDPRASTLIAFVLVAVGVYLVTKK